MHKMVETIPNPVPTRKYTVSDAAKMLQIPVRRLYNHIKLDLIKTTKITFNGKLAIRGSEILRYWLLNH